MNTYRDEPLKTGAYDIDGNRIRVGDTVKFQDRDLTAIIGINKSEELTIRLAAKDLYLTINRAKNLKVVTED